MDLIVGGASVNPLLPFVVATVVSTLMSTAGVSGAFILLPFQVSVLGFTSPAVTPTNHLFNVVAIPSGVYRYVREGRMLWPLTGVIVAGTVPGVIAGSVLRVKLLPDPRHFKLLIGVVLLLLGLRLLATALRPERVAAAGAPLAAGEFRVRVRRFDWRRLEFEFQGASHAVSTVPLAVLTAIVGVAGGAYGVGGGAIIAPVLVSAFRLPVHTIAGATLLGTCLTSVIAVAFFSVLGPLLGQGSVAPHWGLGLALGAGGLLGMYAGARLQRFLPARVIGAVLAVATTALALGYVIGFVRG